MTCRDLECPLGQLIPAPNVMHVDLQGRHCLLGVLSFCPCYSLHFSADVAKTTSGSDDPIRFFQLQQQGPLVFAEIIFEEFSDGIDGFPRDP